MLFRSQMSLSFKRLSRELGTDAKRNIDLKGWPAFMYSTLGIWLCALMGDFIKCAAENFRKPQPVTVTHLQDSIVVSLDSYHVEILSDDTYCVTQKKTPEPPTEDSPREWRIACKATKQALSVTDFRCLLDCIQQENENDRKLLHKFLDGDVIARQTDAADDGSVETIVWDRKTIIIVLSPKHALKVDRDAKGRLGTVDVVLLSSYCHTGELGSVKVPNTTDKTSDVYKAAMHAWLLGWPALSLEQQNMLIEILMDDIYGGVHVFEQSDWLAARRFYTDGQYSDYSQTPLSSIKDDNHEVVLWIRTILGSKFKDRFLNGPDVSGKVRVRRNKASVIQWVSPTELCNHRTTCADVELKTFFDNVNIKVSLLKSGAFRLHMEWTDVTQHQHNVNVTDLTASSKRQRLR